MKLEKLVELHDISSFVHGTLFGLHSLGVYYNIKKHRYLDAAIHAGIATYDLVCAVRHKEYSKRNGT